MDAEELMQQISDWSEELLLRGTAQLTLADMEALERKAEDADALQMEFLKELLQHVITEGRNVLLGKVDDSALLLQCSRLCQYAQIGGRAIG